MNTVLAYHFTAATLRDGSPIPPVGQWLTHVGPVVPCASGYHASVCPFDALQFAPGNMLHWVELRGEINGNHADKLVARERRILASVDFEQPLRDFARWNARQVLHLWDAPQVVRDWLETGDEKIRAAARDAARAAARDAARAAARAAATTAAWDAAWDAARYAARAAARYAARDAARDEFRRVVEAAFV